MCGRIKRQKCLFGLEIIYKAGNTPMSVNITIYLDESGDLGFDGSKPKASEYFVITLLVCENLKTAKDIKTAVSRTLRNKLNNKKHKRREVHELKGTSTTLAIKKYFYSQLPESGWTLYCLSLNKKRVAPHLQTKAGKKKLYNFLSRLLVEKIPLGTTVRTINLVVDKCKNLEEQKDFNSYLVNRLESLDLDIRIDINHESSHGNAGLQAVDLFCWGVNRKVSKKDTSWYDIFKSRVVYETIYFPPK